jgi:hypothetical protein
MATVNLTSPASQLAELQRRQKIAEALAAQGAEPIEVGSYKGIQAPISPFSALAKVLQTYMGAKQQADILKERKGVEQRQNQAQTAMGDFISGNPNALSGTPTARAPAPVPNQYTALESSVNAPEPAPMPSVAQPAPMAAQPIAAPSQPAPGAAIANALMAGPTVMPPVESAQAAMPTPQQAMRMDAPSLVQLINFARQNGIDPSPYIEIAKLTQPDFINVNGFVVDPHDPSNAGKYYGGLDEGQQPTLDANGNVISVSTIPGFANSSAEVTGANTAATEREKAKFGFTKVINTDGSESLVRNDVLSGQLGPQPAPSSAPAPGQATQPSPASNRGPTPQQQIANNAFYKAGSDAIIAAPQIAKDATSQSQKFAQAADYALSLDPNAFTDFKLASKNILNAIGFTDPATTDFISKATSYKMLTNGIIIPAVKQLGTNPSNIDLKATKESFGSINTPRASAVLFYAQSAAVKNLEAKYNNFVSNWTGEPDIRKINKAWSESSESAKSMYQDPIFTKYTLYGHPIVSYVEKNGVKYGVVMPYNANGSPNKNATVFKVY